MHALAQIDWLVNGRNRNSWTQKESQASTHSTAQTYTACMTNRDNWYIFLLRKLQHCASKFFILVFSLALVTILYNAFADIPSTLTEPVTDEQGVFSDEARMDIEKTLKKYRDEYQVEGAVLILPTIEGRDIAEYTTSLLNDSWVGRAGIDSGFVLTVATEDRKWFMGTWYWLEWPLPDLRVSRLWDAHFSVFRDGKYWEGVSSFLSSLEPYVSWEFVEPEENESVGSFWLFYALTLVVLWFWLARVVKFKHLAVPSSLTWTWASIVAIIFFAVGVGLAYIVLTYMFMAWLVMLLPKWAVSSDGHFRGWWWTSWGWWFGWFWWGSWGWWGAWWSW